ncbi:MAG TPA: phytoene/squalene synthase family protein [Pseudolabrys sp.]|nr:phytoene/squalene synthase family protein [Pseudolabrys sp.]
MDQNDNYCAALVREADHARYLATLFAPAELRSALFSLYAFDIEISRIRDLAREPMPGEIRLQWWREVLEGARAGEAAANPVSAALLAALARHHLVTAKLTGLVEARRFDIYDEPMPKFAAFQSYASNTAGAIFDCATRILGAASEENTIEAGQAHTIANIIALLPHHAARRQLFVPLDLLRQYGSSPDEVFAMQASDGLRAVLAELRLRARRHLARIAEMSANIPEKIWPAFLSLAPLRPWLSAMESAAYQPFQPPELPAWRRQWRIWRAAKSLERIGR